MKATKAVRTFWPRWNDRQGRGVIIIACTRSLEPRDGRSNSHNPSGLRVLVAWVTYSGCASGTGGVNGGWKPGSGRQIQNRTPGAGIVYQIWKFSAQVAVSTRLGPDDSGGRAIRNFRATNPFRRQKETIRRSRMYRSELREVGFSPEFCCHKVAVTERPAPHLK